MNTKTILLDLFKGLSNTGDFMDQFRSGRVVETNGRITATLADVYAEFYPEDKAPRYYACKKFFAFGSFSQVAGSKKLRTIYNEKNKDKIQLFKSIDEIVTFINSK